MPNLGKYTFNFIFISTYTCLQLLDNYDFKSTV